MRERNNCFVIRLTDKEYMKLTKAVYKSGLSREAYIRKLLNGCIPKELPPIEYHEMNEILYSIDEKLNALYFNGGKVDELMKVIMLLHDVLLNLQKAVDKDEVM